MKKLLLFMLLVIAYPLSLLLTVVVLAWEDAKMYADRIKDSI